MIRDVVQVQRHGAAIRGKEKMPQRLFTLRRLHERAALSQRIAARWLRAYHVRTQIGQEFGAVHAALVRQIQDPNRLQRTSTHVNLLQLDDCSVA